MARRKSNDHFNRNQFILHYQPIINIHRGTVVGVEAFVRWQHPHRGLLFPKDFLPLAEATDLMFKLDQWVLRTACTQVRRWQSEGYSLFLAVNLSASSLAQNHLWRQIVNLLEESHFDPRMLKIELTKNSLIAHQEETRLTMKELKMIDIELGLDDVILNDFYWHLLRDFPFDICKLDSNFLADSLLSSDEQDGIHSWIEMAHSIGKKIIGESVETEKQKSDLHQLKCHLMQGHLWGIPVPAEEFSQKLRSPNSLFTLQPSPLPIAS